MYKSAGRNQAHHTGTPISDLVGPPRPLTPEQHAELLEALRKQDEAQARARREHGHQLRVAQRCLRHAKTAIESRITQDRLAVAGCGTLSRKASLRKLAEVITLEVVPEIAELSRRLGADPDLVALQYRIHRIALGVVFGRVPKKRPVSEF